MNAVRWFLLLTLSVSAPAQLYHISTFTRDDGLPQSQVYAVFQDSRGYMWAGTNGGVSRFDGTDFSNLSVGNGLPDNHVYSIVEDSSGHIWLGTGHGLCEVNTGNYLNLTVESFSGPLTNIPLSKLMWRNAEELWIGTRQNGLHVMREGRFYPHALNEHFPTAAVAQIVKSASGAVWILFKRRALAVVRPDGTRKVYRSAPFNDLVDISLRKNGDLLLLDRNAWHHWKPGDGPPQKISQAFGNFLDYEFASLAVENDSNYYVASNRGLFQINGNRLLRITTDNGLLSDDIRSMFIDRDHHLWAGTYNFGMARLNSTRLLSFNRRTGLRNPVVNCLLELPDGSILLGTDRGIHTLSGNDVHREERFQDLAYRKIRSMYRDRDGIVWIGTDQGINRMNGGRVEKHPLPGFPREIGVTKILQDLDGIYWVGTSRGLFVYDGDATRRISFLDSLGIEEIRTVYIDMDQHLVCGTDRGFVIVEDDEIHHWHRGNGLPDNGINAIYQNMNRDFYLGSDNGLIFWDQDVFSIYREERGLHGRNISALLGNDDGSVWVASEQGLDLFDGDRVTDHLDRRTGLTGNAFTTDNALVRDSRGSLLLGMYGGLTILNPKEQERRPTPPPRVFLVKAEAWKDHEERTPLAITGKNRIPHSRNNVRFEFVSPWYTPGRPIEYICRLVGFDQEWSEFSLEPNIRYTNLPPGKYRLRVRARTADGVSSYRSAFIRFQIMKPFWMESWFLLLAGVLLTWGGYVLVNLRLQSMRRLNRRLEKRVERRTRELIEAKAYIEQIVEHAGNVIASVDENGKIVSWNREGEKLFGYQRNKLRNKKLSVLDLKDDPHPLMNLLADVRRDGPVRHLEVKKRTRDGETAEILLSISHFKNLLGEPAGFSIVMSDISERNRLQEEMLKQEQLRGGISALHRLLATLSHYINNSAAAILGMVQVYESTGKFADRMAVVSEEQAERIIAIVKSLGYLVENFNLKTSDYIYEKDGIFDIEKEIEDFIEHLRTEKELRTRGPTGRSLPTMLRKPVDKG